MRENAASVFISEGEKVRADNIIAFINSNICELAFVVMLIQHRFDVECRLVPEGRSICLLDDVGCWNTCNGRTRSKQCSNASVGRINHYSPPPSRSD